MQTRATIIYNSGQEAQYVVCMNYVIGEEEGWRYLRETEGELMKDACLVSSLASQPKLTTFQPSSQRDDHTYIGNSMTVNGDRTAALTKSSCAAKNPPQQPLAQVGYCSQNQYSPSGSSSSASPGFVLSDSSQSTLSPQSEAFAERHSSCSAATADQSKVAVQLFGQKDGVTDSAVDSMSSTEVLSFNDMLDFWDMSDSGLDATPFLEAMDTDSFVPASLATDVVATLANPIDFTDSGTLYPLNSYTGGTDINSEMYGLILNSTSQMTRENVSGLLTDSVYPSVCSRPLFPSHKQSEFLDDSGKFSAYNSTPAIQPENSFMPEELRYADSSRTEQQVSSSTCLQNSSLATTTADPLFVSVNPPPDRISPKLHSYTNCSPDSTTSHGGSTSYSCLQQLSSANKRSSEPSLLEAFLLTDESIDPNRGSDDVASDLLKLRLRERHMSDDLTGRTSSSLLKRLLTGEIDRRQLTDSFQHANQMNSCQSSTDYCLEMELPQPSSQDIPCMETEQDQPWSPDLLEKMIRTSELDDILQEQTRQDDLWLQYYIND